MRGIPNPAELRGVALRQGRSEVGCLLARSVFALLIFLLFSRNLHHEEILNRTQERCFTVPQLYRESVFPESVVTVRSSLDGRLVTDPGLKITNLWSPQDHVRVNSFENEGIYCLLSSQLHTRSTSGVGWQRLYTFLRSLSGGLLTPASALARLEIIEVLFDGNHSLATDYGVSVEPYGLKMISGQPYIEPLLVDAAPTGEMHVVYHHCPYNDAFINKWNFKTSTILDAEAAKYPNENLIEKSRRKKLCVARRVQLAADGEPDGSETTMLTGSLVEPRFFAYRITELGYGYYFVAWARMLPSACQKVSCCSTTSQYPCEILFHKKGKPNDTSKYFNITNISSVKLSQESIYCQHGGGKDGIPSDYFVDFEGKMMTQNCPRLSPLTYGESFNFLGPSKEEWRVQKYYAVGAMVGTLQLRSMSNMTQTSPFFPNNMWLSQAGAAHANFNPNVKTKTYYIVRGSEYTVWDYQKIRFQTTDTHYDSLTNANENKGHEYIKGFQSKHMSMSKGPKFVYREHPIAFDMSFFKVSDVGVQHSVFESNFSFRIPLAKVPRFTTIRNFCVAPLYFDQWAMIAVFEEYYPRDVKEDQAVNTSTTDPPIEADDPMWVPPTDYVLVPGKDDVDGTPWDTERLPGFGVARLKRYTRMRPAQMMYLEIPINGKRSYNERTLVELNADTLGGFQCEAAGSASFLVLYQDDAEHLLYVEERLRDGTVIEDSHFTLRRVLYGSLLPTKDVPSLEKGPSSLIWVNLLTTKRFSIDESPYFVPGDLPGRVAGVVRASTFYADGDCIGSFTPPLANAVCSEFCVSMHMYEITTPAKGGRDCIFANYDELAQKCFDAPCNRAEVSEISVNGGLEDATRRQTLPSRAGGAPLLREKEVFSEISNSTEDFAELFDGKWDTYISVALPEKGKAATVQWTFKSPMDLWNIRIGFASGKTPKKGLAGALTTGVMTAFPFSLSVFDDAGYEIHTWKTQAPPSIAHVTVWEALDLRLYRAKRMVLSAENEFRLGELELMGMPLDECPTSGFLGPSECKAVLGPVLKDYSSVDCQGAWSEWTGCQVDCRRTRFQLVYQTEKAAGKPCEYFQQEPCTGGLCSALSGLSLERSEDCYPSASRWSECVGCQRIRVWHVLRAPSGSGRPCQPFFETEICTGPPGCSVQAATFSPPPEEELPDVEADEFELLRPVAVLFLAAAIGVVIILLLALEAYRQWGVSGPARREAISVQRQHDLRVAQRQIQHYRQMLREFQAQLDSGEIGLDAALAMTEEGAPEGEDATKSGAKEDAENDAAKVSGSLESDDSQLPLFDEA